VFLPCFSRFFSKYAVFFPLFCRDFLLSLLMTSRCAIQCLSKVNDSLVITTCWFYSRRTCACIEYGEPFPGVSWARASCGARNGSVCRQRRCSVWGSNSFDFFFTFKHLLLLFTHLLEKKTTPRPQISFSVYASLISVSVLCEPIHRYTLIYDNSYVEFHTKETRNLAYVGHVGWAETWIKSNKVVCLSEIRVELITWRSDMWRVMKQYARFARRYKLMQRVSRQKSHFLHFRCSIFFRSEPHCGAAEERLNCVVEVYVTHLCQGRIQGEGGLLGSDEPPIDRDALKK